MADMDPSGFGVVEYRSTNMPGSEPIESFAVELVALSLVDLGQVGDDSISIGDDPMEQCAGVDRR
jgi:hypothetical protein